MVEDPGTANRCDRELRELYEQAIYCICDSRIPRLLARLRGIRLPLIAGSDLRSAAEFIAKSGARFTFIAVGMPHQEMIAWEAAKTPGAKGMAFCVGAALEFLTGEQKRAPYLLQRLHLEWAHRLATNPRRLWRRYLVEGSRIVPIYFRWRRRRA